MQDIMCGIPVEASNAFLSSNSMQSVEGAAVEWGLAAHSSAHAQAHVLCLQPRLHHPQRICDLCKLTSIHSPSWHAGISTAGY